MQISVLISKLIKLVLLLALIFTLFFKSHHHQPIYSLGVASQKKLEKDVLLKNGLLQDSGFSLSYQAKLEYKDIYPAFFGLHWLWKDFKFK